MFDFDFLLLIGSGMESFIISDQNSKGSGSDHNQKIKCKELKIVKKIVNFGAELKSCLRIGNRLRNKSGT